MLKNKSIDYIFGMITGISVSITFWACTNTDLIASNDTSVESNAVQEVKITNWSSMPEVKISSLGNDVDCDVDFPYSMNVAVTNTPNVAVTNTPTVKFSSLGNNVEINGSIDCDVDFPSSMNVTVTNTPMVGIHSSYNDVDCDIDDSPAIKVDVINTPTIKIHSSYNDVDCDIDDSPAIKVDVTDMPYGCCP